jgi:hypothetical protein
MARDEAGHGWGHDRADLRPPSSTSEGRRRRSALSTKRNGQIGAKRDHQEIVSLLHSRPSPGGFGDGEIAFGDAAEEVARGGGHAGAGR